MSHPSDLPRREDNPRQWGKMAMHDHGTQRKSHYLIFILIRITTIRGLLRSVRTRTDRVLLYKSRSSSNRFPTILVTPELEMYSLPSSSSSIRLTRGTRSSQLPTSRSSSVDKESRPCLQSTNTQDVYDTISSTRKSYKTLRGGERVWPPELEAALIEGEFVRHPYQVPLI